MSLNATWPKNCLVFLLLINITGKTLYIWSNSLQHSQCSYNALACWAFTVYVLHTSLETSPYMTPCCIFVISNKFAVFLWPRAPIPVCKNKFIRLSGIVQRHWNPPDLPSGCLCEDWWYQWLRTGVPDKVAGECNDSWELEICVTLRLTLRRIYLDWQEI